MAEVIGNIQGRKKPFSIDEHVDSYVIPAGYYAKVYVKNTAVRKETAISAGGHLYLGLTIDGDLSFPVLSGWNTDFDGDGASNEAYVLLETSGIINAWCNSTAINFGRMNKADTAGGEPSFGTNLSSYGTPLDSFNLTADDANEFFVQKYDVFYIPGTGNNNADIQYITRPNHPLPKEFWVPAGTTLETGAGNGSAYNLQYTVELYEE